MPTVIQSCSIGTVRCSTVLERCEAGDAGPAWVELDNCLARGLVCSAERVACLNCLPNSQTCDGQTVLRCDDAGESFSSVAECNPELAEACRGGRCTNLCTLAAEERSNVGCEYWAVDLDNAVAGPTLNAAAQQFAVVVSNPQPDLPALVRIERDDSLPNQPGNPVEVIQASVAPFNLLVFPLPPREVDGSPAGEYNTGTHTALTRHGYRITSTVPVVAYQFNPLENVDVFSNDASLLKPVEALRGSPGTLEDAYVVLGWPQTIASTDDPNTNFGSDAPLDFRAFLTIAATRDNTRVRVTSSARVISGGPVPELSVGGSAEFVLGAFDVLNLETDDFGGDFTSSVVASDAPVAVFSGGEASDAPRFDRIAERRCCADHLEEQLDPIRSAGKRFVAPLSFNRHLALANAGALLQAEPEQEVFRLIAVLESGANVRTSLDGELSEFRLEIRGSWREIVSTKDFWIESDSPVMLGNVTASQSAAGIAGNLPGGDPSFIIIPPIEQFRADYVFLTPDRYSFDFLRIMAPRTATVRVDTVPLDRIPGCHLESGSVLDRPLEPASFGYVVYRCQLSFPIIDPTLDGADALAPGEQSDGVHEVRSDQPIGVIVDGFDRNVSYGYAAGTELREIVPRCLPEPPMRERGQTAAHLLQILAIERA
ncbi:MAG TPA: IgGFc-binding protein, partial [Polyangiaceae bacterium]|nr:IgGFc-binding protein [Polyangiaceae bacterium]